MLNMWNFWILEICIWIIECAKKKIQSCNSDANFLWFLNKTNLFYHHNVRNIYITCVIFNNSDTQNITIWQAFQKHKFKPLTICSILANYMTVKFWFYSYFVICDLSFKIFCHFSQFSASLFNLFRRPFNFNTIMPISKINLNLKEK